MSKSFTVLVTDGLPHGAGQRSIDAEWQAMLARPDAEPLPPEPVRVRPDVALVALIVRRLAWGAIPSLAPESASHPDADDASGR